MAKGMNDEGISSLAGFKNEIVRTIPSLEQRIIGPKERKKFNGDPKDLFDLADKLRRSRGY
jgi:hypothetical protein